MMERRRRLTVFLMPSQATQPELIWEPATDVYRTREGWLLKLDVAGVRLEDVAVTVAGPEVKVSGVRRDCITEEECNHYSMEISYTRFRRVVTLPEAPRLGQIGLEFRDGFLLVRLQ